MNCLQSLIGSHSLDSQHSDMGCVPCLWLALVVKAITQKLTNTNAKMIVLGKEPMFNNIPHKSCLLLTPCSGIKWDKEMVWFPKPFIMYVVPIVPSPYEADAVIACMARGHVWQERRSLQRAVPIPLECNLVLILIAVMVCKFVHCIAAGV